MHGLLDSVPETEVVGEATTGDEVIAQAAALQPDVLSFVSTPRLGVPVRVFPELTDREAEVLSLVAEGRTNEEIAKHLVLNLKTVRNHVSNIFSKLQVADRAHFVIREREAGLGHDAFGEQPEAQLPKT